MSVPTEAVRAEFPILQRAIHGHPLAYLDNASTTQKPKAVIEAFTEFWSRSNANIHRGVYQLSEEASDAYEQARSRVACFLNAPEASQVIFTRGTTESINLAAYAWARPRLQPDDRILLTEMEHHSNQVPWQVVAQERGAQLDYVPILDSGVLDLEFLQTLLCRRPKLLAVTAISNVLGTINPLPEIIALAHKHEVPVLVDAAQAVGRFPLDVRALDCDFLAFSGHKVYGPTGIGALYVQADRLAEMQPWQGGGGMISRVSRERSTWAEAPAKFEAGTPPVAEAVGLNAALDFVERWGIAEIQQHERDLTDLALGLLVEEPGVTLFGPSSTDQRSGLISFALEGVHPHDVAQILDESGIAVRAGHHCAQVLHERLQVPATVRMSFGIYNTDEEVRRTQQALAQVREVFA